MAVAISMLLGFTVPAKYTTAGVDASRIPTVISRGRGMS